MDTNRYARSHVYAHTLTYSPVLIAPPFYLPPLSLPPSLFLCPSSSFSPSFPPCSSLFPFLPSLRRFDLPPVAIFREILRYRVWGSKKFSSLKEKVKIHASLPAFTLSQFFSVHLSSLSLSLYFTTN